MWHATWNGPRKMVLDTGSAALALVTVAAAQFFSGEDVTENLERCVASMEHAAAQGAKLVVLPENSNRVRNHADRQSCFEGSEDLGGKFVQGLCRAAGRLDMYVAVGVDLRGKAAPDVHICSVLIAPSGEIAGVVKKNVLWDYEYTLFVPGDDPFQVFDTAIGQIGLQLCADGIVPETPRILALQGAQILCNSLNSRGPDELRVHVPLRAMENRVWHIAANTVGGPADQWPWMGGSQIVGPDGTAAAIASEEDEEVIVATIDVTTADSKEVEGIGSIFDWRRPDLYGVLGQPTGQVPAAAMYGPAPATMPKRPITVALMQVSYFHNTPWTVHRAQEQIRYAATRGVNLGVLPSMFCLPRDAAAKDPVAAAQITANALAALCETAGESQIWVAVHGVERAGDDLYSTTFLLDPSGSVCHRYRKVHLNEVERAWASPGDALEVVDLAIGRLAFLVTDEIWIPEAARVLALEGAEILVHCADWDRPEAATIAATERGEENRFHVVSVNRLDSPAAIGSQVVRIDSFAPHQPIALMRFPTAVWTRYGFEEQLVVDLDLRDANDKMMGHHLDPLARRHPKLYGSLL
jgi:predicted amidohydrolase